MRRVFAGTKLKAVAESGEIGEVAGYHMKMVGSGNGGWDVPWSSFEWQLEQIRRGRGILHAKYMVADGHAGYLGSHNFDWRSLTHVQELGLLIRDAASFLGVSEATLRNWDREGKIAAYRNPINGYRLFRRSDLEAPLKNVARSGRQRRIQRRAF